MKNILVLDDNPDLVDILVHALQGGQRQVRGFSDPLQALSALVASPTDLFIADLSLPWIDGEDVIHCARQRRPGLAVFLLSGHSRGADVARSAGVPFFHKPVDLMLLRSSVEQALVAMSEAQV
jgi:DNA-binding NtrC family response regulator